jgi:murein L,D-transpeptidase YafK
LPVAAAGRTIVRNTLDCLTMQCTTARRPIGRIAVVVITFTAACALLSAQALPAGTIADRVVIEKRARTLSLFHGDQKLKTYKIALGANPVGPKQQQGDGRTPEGTYVIDGRKRDSAFHRALHISYPNAADRRLARQHGVSPGGDIMIHGLPNGWSGIGRAHTLRDWTQGCIAVTNEEIEEIWRAIPNGTPVVIRP